ncbi:S-adenosylmethionine-dependent methyltransferase [Penicillium verhagenii]|nr:S-adenosylmethionine-dependent methyltransferase [Penicillium verhagenii]
MVSLVTVSGTALFNLQSLFLVILLLICTSTYAHSIMPGIMDRNQNGRTTQPLCQHMLFYDGSKTRVSLIDESNTH